LRGRRWRARRTDHPADRRVGGHIGGVGDEVIHPDLIGPREPRAAHRRLLSNVRRRAPGYNDQGEKERYGTATKLHREPPIVAGRGVHITAEARRSKRSTVRLER
jgi:hypothetical protein